MGRARDDRPSIELDGIIFRQQKDGYYASGRSIKLHRYVWEKENGKIPEGYHIHHKDFKINKNLNNDISNLQCLSKSDHRKLHNREISDETRKKLSDANKGHKRGLGNKHSKETREKLSRSLKGNKNGLGKIKSKETLEKMYKKVRCIETDIVYASREEAGKSMGLKSYTGISSCCTGKRNVSAGFHWEYA